MVMKNGSQTIKMSPSGMVIQNQGGHRITMNHNGIQVFHQQSQYTNFPNQNFNFQVNYGNNQEDYDEENYEEAFSEESSSQCSYYEEDSGEYENNGEYEEDTDFSYQSEQGFNVNVGWHSHNNINIHVPHLHSNNSAQQMYMEPQQPKSQGLTKAQINQLASSTYQSKSKKVIKPSKGKNLGKNVNKNEESLCDSCPICIMNYKDGEKIKSLPCLHKFHKNCIDKWLEIKSDCPMCKFDILDYLN